MKFGLYMPNLNECSDPHVLVDLTVEAEKAGWDGVYVWDSIFVSTKDQPTFSICDPWIALASIASSKVIIKVFLQFCSTP